MKQLPFDSSQCDGSNGSIFMFLRPLDAEIFSKTSKWRSTEIVKNANLIDVLSNNLAPNGHKKVKILPVNCHIKRNRIMVFLFFYNY